MYEAAEKMASLEVGFLPVIENRESSRLVGVITDRDIVVRHTARRHEAPCSVDDHMTCGDLVSVREDDDVQSVIRRMRETGLRRMPVLDPRERVVGLASLSDLLLALEAVPDA